MINRRQLLTGVSTLTLAAGFSDAYADDCAWIQEVLYSIAHEEKRVAEWVAVDAPLLVGQMETQLSQVLDEIAAVESNADIAGRTLFVNLLAAAAAVTLALLAIPAVAGAVTAATGLAITTNGLILAGVATGTTMFIIRGVFAPESLGAKTAVLRVTTDVSRMLTLAKMGLVGVMKAASAFAKTLLSNALAAYRVLAAIESGKTYADLAEDISNLKTEMNQLKTNITVYRDPMVLTEIRMETLASNRAFFQALLGNCSPNYTLP